MKTHRFSPLLPLALITSLVLVSHLAHAAAAPPSKAALQAQLAAQNQRATTLLSEVRDADQRIEDRVDAIVETLRKIGDSKDSRSKVVRIKEKSIEALRKNLDYYQRRRADLQEQLRRPTLNLTEQEKRQTIDKFDARIEKRVAQILALNKSLPTHQDYEQYKATGSNWFGTTYEVNQDYVQNQRLTAHSNTMRKQIADSLQRSIDRLDQQNRDLQTQSAKATDEAQRSTLASELAKNDALLKARRAQRADVLNPTATPTKQVGQKEANDLNTALNKAITDLRREFDTLFAGYSALLAARSAVNTTRASLAAAAPAH